MAAALTWGRRAEKDREVFRCWVWTESKSVEQLSNALGTWIYIDIVESTGVLPLISPMMIKHCPPEDSRVSAFIIVSSTDSISLAATVAALVQRLPWHLSTYVAVNHGTVECGRC